MIDISFGRQWRQCGGVTRRDFLRLGTLAPLGLSLPGLLAAEKANAAVSGAAASLARRARAKSVILVYLGGGISHHDTFDPKPDALEEIRGKYSTIPTTVSGLRISEMLPRLAHRMQHFALVRSGTHENDHHETASNWVLSGRFGSPFGDHPAMGAIVAHETGFGGRMPPYVAVPKNPSFTWELGKAAWLGGRFESFSAGNPNQKEWQVRDLSRPAGVSDEVLARRKALLASVDRMGGRVHGNDQLDTHDEFARKAAELVLSPNAREAFSVEREDARTRDAYGRSEFGQSCLLARRLVEAGVRFTAVMK